MEAFAIRLATPEDAPAVASVHVQSWRSSYQGLLDPAFLRELKASSRVEDWSRRLASVDHATFFATRSHRRDAPLVGFCRVGPHQSLYLLEEVQRLGLGKALFSEAREWLQRCNFESFCAWVLSSNVSASLFYQAMGGVRAAEKRAVVGGREATLVAYGWRLK